MDPTTMAALGKIGAAGAIGMAAAGSALGTGVAGMASIGAWKKCYGQGKPAPFQLLIFIGAPLTQTIYGMILMLTISRACNIATYLAAAVVEKARTAAAAAGSTDWLAHVPPDTLVTAKQSMAAAVDSWPAMIGAGILGGFAIGMSAWMQGKAGAAGADAVAETGQGFGNYLITIGIVETVALFVMVFVLVFVL